MKRKVISIITSLNMSLLLGCANEEVMPINKQSDSTKNNLRVGISTVKIIKKEISTNLFTGYKFTFYNISGNLEKCNVRVIRDNGTEYFIKNITEIKIGDSPASGYNLGIDGCYEIQVQSVKNSLLTSKSDCCIYF